MLLCCWSTVGPSGPNSGPSSYHRSSYNSHKPRAPRGTFREPVDRSLIQHLLTHAEHYRLSQEDKEHLRRVLLEPQDGVSAEFVSTEYEIRDGRLHARNPASLHHAPKKLRATLACKRDGWRFFALRDAKTGCGLRTAIESRGQDEDGARDSEEEAGAARGARLLLAVACAILVLPPTLDRRSEAAARLGVAQREEAPAIAFAGQRRAQLLGRVVEARRVAGVQSAVADLIFGGHEFGGHAVLGL